MLLTRMYCRENEHPVPFLRCTAIQLEQRSPPRTNRWCNRSRQCYVWGRRNGFGRRNHPFSCRLTVLVCPQGARQCLYISVEDHQVRGKCNATDRRGDDIFLLDDLGLSGQTRMSTNGSCCRVGTVPSAFSRTCSLSWVCTSVLQR